MDLKVIMAELEYEFSSSEKNGWKLIFVCHKMHGIA